MPNRDPAVAEADFRDQMVAYLDALEALIVDDKVVFSKPPKVPYGFDEAPLTLIWGMVDELARGRGKDRRATILALAQNMQLKQMQLGSELLLHVILPTVEPDAPYLGFTPTTIGWAHLQLFCAAFGELHRLWLESKPMTLHDTFAVLRLDALHWWEIMFLHTADE